MSQATPWPSRVVYDIFVPVTPDNVSSALTCCLGEVSKWEGECEGGREEWERIVERVREKVGRGIVVCVALLFLFPFFLCRLIRIIFINIDFASLSLWRNLAEEEISKKNEVIVNLAIDADQANALGS